MAWTRPTYSLFVYGTLMAPEVIQTLIGRVPNRQPAKLIGYRRLPVKYHVFPAMIQGRKKRDVTNGVLYTDIGGYEIHCLDWFEEPQYYKTNCKVLGENDKKEHDALAYSWAEDVSLLDSDMKWSYDTFRRLHLARYLRDVVEPSAKEIKEMEKGESGAWPEDKEDF